MTTPMEMQYKALDQAASYPKVIFPRFLKDKLPKNGLSLPLLREKKSVQLTFECNFFSKKGKKLHMDVLWGMRVSMAVSSYYVKLISYICRMLTTHTKRFTLLLIRDSCPAGELSVKNVKGKLVEGTVGIVELNVSTRNVLEL